jgi:hypothetical protein
MKYLFSAALVASAAMVAMPAHAASVNFVGSRAVECSITGYNSQVNFGNLDEMGGASPVSTGNVSLYCNQPFTASVTSQNGYLKLVTTNPGNDSINGDGHVFTSQNNPQFAAGLEYGIVIPGAGTFGSQYLNAGTTYTTPTIPAVIANGSANYDTVPGSLPLLGGTYRDTVTLTLTPKGV